MPIKDLQEKYGNTTNTRSLMNKAICAECVGASELLAAIQFASNRRERSQNWATLYELLNKVRDAMTADVAKRYDFKTARESDATNGN
ncbi:MAG: hypothetical protein J6K20_05545 [Thermoguttaceae bacterium]|nr:hypothetical protein [Thermoguttaceae bacterium]MBP3557153.1 hypothetical protein [Thermoguttaceae bacterium]MBR4975619.1 hypothetical protein [Thermoguttaceae bacterium]